MPSVSLVLLILDQSRFGSLNNRQWRPPATATNRTQPQLVVDDVGEHSQARRACNVQIDHPTTPACAGLGPVPLVESWTALGAPILEWFAEH